MMPIAPHHIEMLGSILQAPHSNWFWAVVLGCSIDAVLASSKRPQVKVATRLDALRVTTIIPCDVAPMLRPILQSPYSECTTGSIVANRLNLDLSAPYWSDLEVALWLGACGIRASKPGKISALLGSFL